MRNKYKDTNVLENDLVIQLVEYYKTDEYKEKYAKDLLLSLNSYYNLPFLYEDKDIEKVDFKRMNGVIYFFVYCDLNYIVSRRYLPMLINKNDTDSGGYIVNFVVKSNKNNIKYILLDSYGFIFWAIPLSNLYIYCHDAQQLCNYQGLIDDDSEFEVLNFNESLMERFLSNTNHLYDNGIFILNDTLPSFLLSLKVAIKNNINFYFSSLSYYPSFVFREPIMNIESNDKLLSYSFFSKEIYNQLKKVAYIYWFKYWIKHLSNNDIILCDKRLPMTLRLKLKSLESKKRVEKVLYI